MSLVVPSEIKRDINKYSGYMNPESKFAQKNLKGLFFTPENMKYLSNELYYLITCESYIKDNLADDSIEDIPELLGTHDNPVYGFNNKSSYSSKTKRILQLFIPQKPTIDRIIFGMMECHPLPFDEELGIKNPVQQLHSVNLDFLVKSSHDLIMTPQNLVPGFNSVNPDTGKYEAAEYDYDASSYADGTWHPEHLFTNNTRNRENPYWLPIEVNIYSDPDAKGVGHKYNDMIYNKGTMEYYESKKAYDGSPKGSILKPPPQKHDQRGTSFGQFPGWQTTVNKRFYDRETTQGLRDGGLNDRRVQTPHGYNMKALSRKPNV